MDNDEAMASTPLSAAIRTAAKRLPAVAEAPSAMRPAREAAVLITAEALADASDADDQDATLAPQMVDEAAISLDLQNDRTTGVDLNAPVADRHEDLAMQLLDNGAAVDAGMADARSLARTEHAIGRVMRMRGRDPHADALVLQDVVSAIVTTCRKRGARIDEMDDDALMALVEDSCDAVG